MIQSNNDATHATRRARLGFRPSPPHAAVASANLLAPRRLDSNSILQRLFFYGGLLSCGFLMFVEPYIHGSELQLKTPYITYLLALWIGVSFVVQALHLLKRANPVHISVGQITLLVLVVRALSTDAVKAELLPLSYSIIFMSCAMLAQQSHVSEVVYARILRCFNIVAIVATCYGLSLALGVTEGRVTPNSTLRYSHLLDANSTLFGMLVASALLATRHRAIDYVLSPATLLLGLIKLITFGSKGPIVVGVALCVLTALISALRARRLAVGALIVALLTVATIAVSTFVPLQSYTVLLTNRLSDQDTLNARISEAHNDFEAFLEKPALGWGREVPGTNILGESSYGHVALTGTLARFGLLGTFGLAFFYLGYFRDLVLWYRTMGRRALVFRTFAAGLALFVAYLFVLGNPLFLFTSWGFIPLFLPRVVPDRAP